MSTNFKTAAFLLIIVFCGSASAKTELTIFGTGNTYFVDSTGLIVAYGGAGGLLSADASDTGPGRRIAVIAFDTSGLVGLVFDHVYLSLTEIRTSSAAEATAGIYLHQGTLTSVFGPDLQLVDAVTGSGIGGTHVLVDVTTAVRLHLGEQLEFVLRHDLPDGLYVGFLGSNYESGLPPCQSKRPPTQQVDECQYWAKSRYEYPTLIATSGKSITPFAALLYLPAH